MTSSSAFNSLPTAMPSRFAPRPVARAPKAVREWQILEPTTTGPFTPSNKIITINIPTFGIMDMFRGFLSFDATFTGGSTYRRCHNGIWTAIDRIVVTQAGTGDIENAQAYGRVVHAMYIANREVDVDDYVGSSCWGIGDATQRNTWAAGNSYAIPLQSGFFGLDPIDITELNGQLSIQIHLNDPLAFMEANDQTPALSYSFSNFQFFVEKLSFMSESAESKAIRSRATWKIVSWRDYMVTPALGSTNWTLQVDHLFCHECSIYPYLP